MDVQKVETNFQKGFLAQSTAKAVSSAHGLLLLYQRVFYHSYMPDKIATNTLGKGAFVGYLHLTQHLLFNSSGFDLPEPPSKLWCKMMLQMLQSGDIISKVTNLFNLLHSFMYSQKLV